LAADGTGWTIGCLISRMMMADQFSNSGWRDPTRRFHPLDVPGCARARLTLRRKRCGRGFAYFHANGRRITDPKTVSRLAALAVPPAYADVVYAADPAAPLQAMGRDAAGRCQYRYNSAWERARERRKARRLVRLIDALPRVRRRVAAVLATREPTREFAMASAIALVDAAGLRSGSARHARISGARGAVSLHKSHVRLNGSSITLTFPAKGGKRVMKTVRSARLARAIKLLRRLPGRRLFLFQQDGEIKAIRVREVNAYLCDIASSKLSLKDFRTLRASLHVVRALKRIKRASSQRSRKRQLRAAIKTAADDLANTPAVCHKSYVHEAVVEAFERDALTTAPQGRGQGQAPARQILARVIEDHIAR
jgi:DNA topoisomerase-1